ncbi:hypothetical protein B5C26_18520 [Photorhabdus luminescens]|uniref:Protein CR006 P-loop domain-containing protein n=1 Tax=Photorhabdus luminescens subsp. mexicana TaxID=2100167 RepID=A0A4R4JPA8_PHOLU|nr:AAA family ATPase [Photorhabdus luminescens]OWO80151.1 hypothetical protein B5C26_18520 [Photorhabdus luminescens]TDB56330.1 hypothetical protein C5468_01185 [Photorhabdus luminescens subsp. mexicana]
MIKSLTISGVATYLKEHSVEIDTNKKVNLFYGQNGSGKSTLGRYLQSIDDSQFLNCLHEPRKNQLDILVYNNEFIERNFYTHSHPGIFTFNEENIEAKKIIESKKKHNFTLNERRNVLSNNINESKEEISRLKSELKNLVWNYAADYRDNNNPLHHYLSSYKKSKDKFFEKIFKHSCDIQQDISRDSLEKEVSELFSNEVNSLNYCNEIDNYIYEIETDEIFNEIILGTNDSYLSALITNLNSSDWVKKGLDYLSISDNKCPFCQNIIPVDFGLEINKIFNDTYDKKINLIKEKLTSYQFKCDNILNVLKQINLDERFFDKDNFYKLTAELKKEIYNNISLIKEKITTPSKCLELTKTNYLICEINKIINNINLKIKEYNFRLLNRENCKKELEVRFWSMIKNDLISHFYSYELEVKKLENKIKNDNTELNTIISDINENTKVITDNLARIINIDASIENINNTLLNMGITGFYLEKVHENSDSYKLVREGGLENDVYKSLSEGEKTLIVFLYFIEYCSGSVQKDNFSQDADKIIVIDDPISSLSHNHVYDVASLIQQKIIDGGFSQIFILTHSLFFFHELIKIKSYNSECPKNYNLFRVTKNEYSIISKIKPSEIKNDYQSFWQALKDAKVGVTSSVIIPNMMRNILEYYFTFIHQEDSLKKAIDKICEKEPEYKALYRFISRGSHSDGFNINDYGQIDIQSYFSKFRRIFEETGFHSHYDKMMQD